MSWLGFVWFGFAWLGLAFLALLCFALRFLTSSETNGFGDTYLSLTNFFLSEARKCHFCLDVKPRVTHIGELKKQFLPFRETNVLGSFLRVTIFFSMMPGNSIFPESWNHVSWVPRLSLSYFLHSAVCKCDLCQLTGTGRYFEGNWTVYWRKLDYSWRKLVGLLTVTRRIIDGNCTFSIYGNWVVWIRKLDGLLTENGWAIDGNWTVYWWKEWSIDGSSPADFLHFGGLKMRFCPVPKPAVSWTSNILQLIFIHFGG